MLQIPHSNTFLNNSDIRSLNAALNARKLTSGILSKKFTVALEGYLEKKHTILYSSGTSAAYNLIKALKLKQNDEVLLPNYICESVLRSVLLSGAKPVLYDNAPFSWGSNYNEIKSRLSVKTKVVIVNHTFGIANLDVQKISTLGIKVLEDCCHALVRSSAEIPISKNSLASFYSFNATKLIATGEGGAITTNDSAFYQELLAIKVDSPLSDLTCSLGISQLNHYEMFLKRRKEIAGYYDDEFKDLSIRITTSPSIYFRYPLLVSNQIDFLKNKKISFRKGVDNLLQFNIKKSNYSFPNSLFVYQNTVSIPIYPSLKKKHLKIIADEVKKTIKDV